METQSVLQYLFKQTSLVMQIELIFSPCEPSDILFNVSDAPDVDFKDSQIANAYWPGFYDHESGIRLYRYAIADHCLEKEQFLTFADESETTIFANTTDAFLSNVATGKCVCSFNRRYKQGYM